MGSPQLIRCFHAIGEKIGQANLPSAGGGGLPSSLPGLRAELNRLQGDPQFMKALRDPQHPQHAEVNAQRQQIINKIAEAEKAARS